MFIICFSYVVIFLSCSLYCLSISSLAILLQSQVRPEMCCRNSVLQQIFCCHTFLAILLQYHLLSKNDTAAIFPQMYCQKGVVAICCDKTVVAISFWQYCRNFICIRNNAMYCQNVAAIMPQRVARRSMFPQGNLFTWYNLSHSLKKLLICQYIFKNVKSLNIFTSVK